MDFRCFLISTTRITPDDVIKLRREVFDDVLVSLSEAEGVFALNNEVEETCEEWQHFFVEVMTDYCVHQAKPRGYVSEVVGDWLMAQISADGVVKSCTELELLIKVMERAQKVPDALAELALQQVAIAVLQGDGALIGNQELVKGIIGQAEAQLIRRIIHASGPDGRIHVSQREAEMLFELNDKTAEFENHPEWSDVFVRSVAAHLMSLGGYQSLPREEVIRREAWLDDASTDVFGMLKKTFGSLKDVFETERFGEALGSNSAAMENAWRERNRQSELEAIRENPVNPQEADWLVDWINRDGELHDNERALIEFLKEESPLLDEALQPLIAKLG